MSRQDTQWLVRRPRPLTLTLPVFTRPLTGVRLAADSMEVREHPDHEGTHTNVYDEAPANPPAHCDHRPPKVAALPTEGGVRVRCLVCGTVGPERASPGEAFRALLKIPYRSNRSDVSSNCAVADRTRTEE